MSKRKHCELNMWISNLDLKKRFTGDILIIKSKLSIHSPDTSLIEDILLSQI